MKDEFISAGLGMMFMLMSGVMYLHHFFARLDVTLSRETNKKTSEKDDSEQLSKGAQNYNMDIEYI